MDVVFVGAKVEIISGRFCGEVGIISSHDGSREDANPWLVRFIGEAGVKVAYHRSKQLKVLGDFGELIEDHYLVDWLRSARFPEAETSRVSRKYIEQCGKHHQDLVRD